MGYSPTIISKDQGGAYKGWTVRIHAHDGHLEWVKNNQIVPIRSPQALQTNTWYNYIITFNQTHLKLYLNGKKVDETTYSLHSETTSQARIASHNVYGRYFDGKIDETGFWDKCLNEKEILQLYISGVSITSNPNQMLQKNLLLQTIHF